jgi:hypothetical protein
MLSDGGCYDFRERPAKMSIERVQNERLLDPRFQQVVGFFLAKEECQIAEPLWLGEEPRLVQGR